MPFYLEKPNDSHGSIYNRSREPKRPYPVIEAEVGSPVIVGGETINHVLYVLASRNDPPGSYGTTVYSYAYIEVTGPQRNLTLEEAIALWSEHGIDLFSQED